MATPKVQCDYKQIDCFITPNGVTVTVWLKADRHSVKRYCEDTELPYTEGMKALYGHTPIMLRTLDTQNGKER